MNDLEWDVKLNFALNAAVSPADSPLFTIHGNATELVAVGGFLSGVILESQGGSFADVAAPGTAQMNGVFMRPDGSRVAVGNAGALAFRGVGGWQYQRLNTLLGFHGAWVDPEGGVWTVGGDLIDLHQGMLAYGGVETIGSNILPGSSATREVGAAPSGGSEGRVTEQIAPHS